VHRTEECLSKRRLKMFRLCQALAEFA
jgi:hypothetical protein